MHESKLTPYFNKDDMAILTPPWVVVILVLFSIVTLTLLLWVNRQDEAHTRQVEVLQEQLSTLLKSNTNKNDDQLESLTQIGTSLKFFDSRVKNVNRKLSVIANEVDGQRNATIQMQSDIQGLQNATVNQLSIVAFQLENLSNQTVTSLEFCRDKIATKPLISSRLKTHYPTTNRQSRPR